MDTTKAESVSREPLKGQRQIRWYAGGESGPLSWRTIEHLVREYGFPVIATDDTYFSSRSAIDAWWAAIQSPGVMPTVRQRMP